VGGVELPGVELADADVDGAGDHDTSNGRRTTAGGGRRRR
jgi:hypothetical protein